MTGAPPVNTNEDTAIDISFASEASKLYFGQFDISFQADSDHANWLTYAWHLYTNGLGVSNFDDLPLAYRSFRDLQIFREDQQLRATNLQHTAVTAPCPAPCPITEHTATPRSSPTAVQDNTHPCIGPASSASFQRSRANRRKSNHTIVPKSRFKTPTSKVQATPDSGTHKWKIGSTKPKQHQKAKQAKPPPKKLCNYVGCNQLAAFDATANTYLTHCHLHFKDPVCIRAGCNKPCWYHARSAKFLNYCGNTCKRLANEHLHRPHVEHDGGLVVVTAEPATEPAPAPAHTASLSHIDPVDHTDNYVNDQQFADDVRAALTASLCVPQSRQPQSQHSLFGPVATPPPAPSCRNGSAQQHIRATLTADSAAPSKDPNLQRKLDGHIAALDEYSASAEQHIQNIVSPPPNLDCYTATKPGRLEYDRCEDALSARFYDLDTLANCGEWCNYRRCTDCDCWTDNQCRGCIERQQLAPDNFYLEFLGAHSSPAKHFTFFCTECEDTRAICHNCSDVPWVSNQADLQSNNPWNDTDGVIAEAGRLRALTKSTQKQWTANDPLHVASPTETWELPQAQYGSGPFEAQSEANASVANSAHYSQPAGAARVPDRSVDAQRRYPVRDNTLEHTYTHTSLGWQRSTEYHHGPVSFNYLADIRQNLDDNLRREQGWQQACTVEQVVLQQHILERRQRAPSNSEPLEVVDLD